MIKLEDLKQGMRVKGILTTQVVVLVSVEPSGRDSVNVIYRERDGHVAQRPLFRENEDLLSAVTDEHVWPFDGDDKLLKLVSEAYRIHRAPQFDQMLAVQSSLIDPLPHQISAVYHEMLTRHPLRFLLADDAGAGKTIMAGMLIFEMIARGDIGRCLICAPGSLTKQWEEELRTKFQLTFNVLTRDSVDSRVNRNPFLENDRVIVSRDRAKRDEYIELLRVSNWDLVICDEAHRMSAPVYGNKPNKTRNYRLGEILSERTRHFLLLTATPHNGKEKDFQMFLRLLDKSRFAAGRNEEVLPVDAADLMRRMVKEDLLTFDNKRLLPDRLAYNVDYDLSPDEHDLYQNITEYVRSEYESASSLTKGRQNNINWALMALQRRLASSPEAIYQSLRSRRKGLQKRLDEWTQFQNTDGDSERNGIAYEQYSDDRAELVLDIEFKLICRETAATTFHDLREEIETLVRLENQALRICRSDTDKKWEQLRGVFNHAEMKDRIGNQRKIIIFTEYRATLDYLAAKLENLLGYSGAVAVVHGGVPIPQRHDIQQDFQESDDLVVLVATDALGEGINNLHCANLMVNYDLPWNPNRIEQRFGRIHRIGQKEVCHLWNLVAKETREGVVYSRLLEKLETQRDALGGRVFDILGQSFYERPLSDLVKEAFLYGDDPEVKAKLEKAVDDGFERAARARALLEEQSLMIDKMDTSKFMSIRDDVDRARANRLQPFHVKNFLLSALGYFGGMVQSRRTDPGRYLINSIPRNIREHANSRGMGRVKESYARICFDKELIRQRGKANAELICPGHPLLDSVVSLLLNRYGGLLQRGALLIDENDSSTCPRVMFLLEHKIHDGTLSQNREENIVSRELHFVEIKDDQELHQVSVPPYLDYRSATNNEKAKIESEANLEWFKNGQADQLARGYAIEHLVPSHRDRVRAQHQERISKNVAAVKRLQKVQGQQLLQCQQDIEELQSIIGKRRVHQLRQNQQGLVDSPLSEYDAQEQFERLEGLGIPTLVSLSEAYEENMRLRYFENHEDWHQLENGLYLRFEDEENLQQWSERLNERMEDLSREMQISPGTPTIIGGALIVPAGLLSNESTENEVADRHVAKEIAMQAVINVETARGNFPTDVSNDIRGYDVESRDDSGQLRFIEVKGHHGDADIVTLTRNELITALNCGEQYILALVLIEDKKPREPIYIKGYPFREPDPSASSVDFKIKKLLEHSEDSK